MKTLLEIQILIFNIGGDTMGKRFTKEYELHYYDVDKNLRGNMSTIINILSDIGTKQSEELGSGMKDLLDQNMTWVFYNYHVKIFRSPSVWRKIICNNRTCRI